MSKRSAEFLRKFYPDAAIDEWNDWRWQNRNRVRTLADLERMVELSAEELAAIKRHNGALPLGIVPYYASLLEHRSDTGTAAHRGAYARRIPDLARRERRPARRGRHSPVPGLVHRYPDRVLLLVTNFCSVYCRYCTRARMVGSVGERSVKKSDIELALDYIEQQQSHSRCADFRRRPAQPRRRSTGVHPEPAAQDARTSNSFVSAASNRSFSLCVSRLL